MHYWLPARLRHLFAVFYVVLGYVVLLGPIVAGLVMAAGLISTASCGVPSPGWVRVGIVLVGAFTVGRTTGAPGILGVLAILGSLFMFRLIVYLYDVRYANTARLLDFLGYFLLLPNCYFLLFPVVDHATFLVCRDRPLDDVVQTGIRWILRGVVQLVLYRFIDAYRPIPRSPRASAAWWRT